MRAIKARGGRSAILIVSQYPDVEIDGDFVVLGQSPAVLSKRYGVNVIGAVVYDFQDRRWFAQVQEVISKL